MLQFKSDLRGPFDAREAKTQQRNKCSCREALRGHTKGERRRASSIWITRRQNKPEKKIRKKDYERLKAKSAAIASTRGGEVG